jgi:hypothetical protein
MSQHIAKLVKNPLVLIAAALVIHIGAATAVDLAGDPQQQARELLTGTTGGHHAPRAAPRDRKQTGPTVDAQELARQLLLGTTGARGGATKNRQLEVARASGEASRQSRAAAHGGAAHGDAQEAARQLLLGQPVASEAVGPVAR